MPKNQLIDLYGSAAFTLNYPNVWGPPARTRRQWHLAPRCQSDTYLPPLASKGCIVLTNPDIDATSPPAGWRDAGDHQRQGRVDSKSQYRQHRDGAWSIARSLAHRRQERWLGIDADKLSIFRNPGKEEVLVVNFEQASHGPAEAGAKSQKKSSTGCTRLAAGRSSTRARA